MINKNVDIIRTSRKEMRESIIDFFKDKKLNKNCYFIEFYRKRNSEHIFHYLNTYFNKKDVLFTASIAQKYYHIFHDLKDVPKNKKFINFINGYTKGVDGRKMNTRKLSWLIDSINNKKIVSKPNYSITITLDKLIDYTRRVAYKPLVNDDALLESIMWYTSNINDGFNNFEKLVIFYNRLSDYYCRCGEKRKHFHLKLLKTCGNPICINLNHSERTKIRDLSYLQSDEAKLKRVNSRRWYKPSEECKLKLSIANKKFWTKDRKKK